MLIIGQDWTNLRDWSNLKVKRNFEMAIYGAMVMGRRISW